MRGRGRGRGAKPGPRVPAAFSIFSEGVAAHLPPQLEGDSQAQLIAAFKAVRIKPAVKRPLRPEYGNLGSDITLRTNFFPVRLPKGPFWDYTVTIKVVKPEGESQSSRKGKERDTGKLAAKGERKDGSSITAAMRRRIFELLVKDPSLDPYRAHIAHDYSQRIIAAKQLPQPFNIPIQYVEEDEEHPRDDAKLYSITIEFDCEIDINTIVQ